MARSKRAKWNSLAVTKLFHFARFDPQIVVDHGEVEASEVEQLGDRRIGHQRLEARRLIISRAQLHEMRVAVARRQLHETQPVAMRVEPHRLGINRDRRSEVDAVGKVAAMERVAHASLRNGAQEKTRTSTTLLPQVPETCASTNSATWAFDRRAEISRPPGDVNREPAVMHG